MSESKSVSVQVGPGFLGMLFLVFLALKLTRHIAWSWWWVTAPLWAPLVILAVMTVIMGFIYAVLTLAILAWGWVEKRWRAR